MSNIDWQQYKIEQDKKFNLGDWDPEQTRAWKGDKELALSQIEKLNIRLEALQELLFAQRKNKILIVLQGMDTSGKDGVISKVFDGVNPQGVRVASFKVPTPEELSHDYLWRTHKVVPGSGEMVIFNRSHYEDVLVVRVHNLVPPERWKLRYDQIKDFERILVEEGTIILKFFLHIDAEEQRQRLLERLEDPSKVWKFNPGDLKERELWVEYQKAYEDAISKTSTERAPWILVPANKKWYRDLVILAALVDTLEGLKMQYPQPSEDYTPYRTQLAGK